MADITEQADTWSSSPQTFQQWITTSEAKSFLSGYVRLMKKKEFDEAFEMLMESWSNGSFRVLYSLPSFASQGEQQMLRNMFFKEWDSEVDDNTILAHEEPIYEIIPPEKFESFLAEIRNAIGKESKEDRDPFLEAIIKKYPHAVDYKNQISQKIGTFHQKMMGEFSGWKSVAHGKGVDVFSNDGKTVIEVKNKYNTMNHDSKKSVMDKLQKFVSDDKTAILCIVNIKNNKLPRYPEAGDIQIKSGKEMYKMLSGRETFLDDLLATFSEKI